MARRQSPVTETSDHLIGKWLLKVSMEVLFSASSAEAACKCLSTNYELNAQQAKTAKGTKAGHSVLNVQLSLYSHGALLCLNFLPFLQSPFTLCMDFFYMFTCSHAACKTSTVLTEEHLLLYKYSYGT